MKAGFRFAAHAISKGHGPLNKGSRIGGRFLAMRKLALRRLFVRTVGPRGVPSPWLRYGLAVVLPILGFLVSRLALELEWTPNSSLFLSAVVIAALVGGWGPGFVATIFSAILSDLVSMPTWMLYLPQRENAVRLSLFAVLGCSISILVGAAGGLRRKLARERFCRTFCTRSDMRLSPQMRTRRSRFLTRLPKW